MDIPFKNIGVILPLTETRFKNGTGTNGQTIYTEDVAFNERWLIRQIIVSHNHGSGRDVYMGINDHTNDWIIYSGLSQGSDAPLFKECFLWLLPQQRIYASIDSLDVDKRLFLWIHGLKYVLEK